MTMTLIETKTVGAGGSASIDFTSIPGTYTDLYLVVSGRTDKATVVYDDCYIKFNTSSANFTHRRLEGNGSSASSGNAASGLIGESAASGATSNTFANIAVYIPNYAGSTNKSYSADSVQESNQTSSYQDIIAGLWSQTAAITSISIYNGVGNFVQYSTASLYGITKTVSADGTVQATGGTITKAGGYVYHTFTSSGTFTPTTSLTAEVLVIAGGGGGGRETRSGGGGGAGGLQVFSAQSLTATGYTVTVGAGGAGAPAANSVATSGNNSSFGALTASVGGGRGSSGGTNAGTGGSGGGYAQTGTGGTGAAGTSGQGFAGGGGYDGGYPGNDGNYFMGGGGGGAGAAGNAGATNNTTSGNGGIGAYLNVWADATSTGVSGYYAGGGGGARQIGGTGTLAPGGAGGGGGSTFGVAGTANTGGGGGAGTGSLAGNGVASAGGSGLVIVRYKG